VIDAINDPKDGWQYGENHNTGKYAITIYIIMSNYVTQQERMVSLSVCGAGVACS